MDIVLEIAYAILVIGAALCVVALFVLLLYVISLVAKVRNIVKQTQRTYEQAMYFALAPLQKVTDWLLQDDSQEDDER